MTDTLQTPPATPVGAPLAQVGVAGGSGAMFDRIAARYDLLNRWMTFGVDQGWRRRAVRMLQATKGARILDLATGTADLAVVAARQLPDAHVTGLDPSEGMMAVGRAKIARLGLVDRIELLTGDAQALPFDDASFDGITMGFGIRNVPDRAAALREMARVLKPGARVVILETSQPRGGPIAWGARLYMGRVVPWLGGLLAGAPVEYKYLHESTADFPDPQAFAALMTSCGLRVLDVVPLLAGVAVLHCAERPRD
jgi:demethylmenaquinone methyltransferase/2-methoxy-6-polyprenyl-1,4-benzoquinol methylase